MVSPDWIDLHNVNLITVSSPGRLAKNDSLLNVQHDDLQTVRADFLGDSSEYYP